LEWLTQRQLQIEGGFNGRINKLVDCCYNFWQGATFELLDICAEGKMNLQGEWLYNQHALQAYTTFCCQPAKGGLRDKPTKGPDPYHTMYGMAGNSVA
jgi:protein farnesyltransferase subunit beta